MKITLVPGGETYDDLLTVEEIANFAGISDPEADTKIRRVSNGVLHHMERDLGRAFPLQNVELTVDCQALGWIYGFGQSHWEKIKLPFPPLQEVTSVKWLEWDGTEHDIDESKWASDTRCEPGVVKFTGDGYIYPDDLTPKGKDCLVVNFQCGYRPGRWPDGLKLIAKRIIATHIENPENTIAGIDESVLLLPPELANTMELYRVYDFDIEYGVQ